MRGAALAGLLLVVAIALGRMAFGGTHKSSDLKPVKTRAERVAKKPTPTRQVHLVAHPAGRLVDPVQDASVVALDGSHAMLLGGLTAADTSTDSVRLISARGSRSGGRL